jgi:hypothetical protein
MKSSIADHSGRGDHVFESHLRWECLCTFILFVPSCVQVAALRRADPTSKESYRVKDQETEKAAKVQRSGRIATERQKSSTTAHNS